MPSTQLAFSTVIHSELYEFPVQFRHLHEPQLIRPSTVKHIPCLASQLTPLSRLQTFSMASESFPLPNQLTPFPIDFFYLPYYFTLLSPSIRIVVMVSITRVTVSYVYCLRYLSLSLSIYLSLSLSLYLSLCISLSIIGSSAHLVSHRYVLYCIQCVFLSFPSSFTLMVCVLQQYIQIFSFYPWLMRDQSLGSTIVLI